MNKLKCIIIEDEPIAIEVLIDYMEQVPYLECQAKFTDAIFALKYLENNRADIIFLDIHLPKLNGLEFIKRLNSPTKIIFTTAYQEYALQGYELNVVDYLLKPFSFSRFLLAVQKVSSSLINLETENTNFIFVTVNKKNVKIYYQDIYYIESLKEYIKIFTNDKVHVVKSQIGQIEKILPPTIFKRIHRSFIINPSKLQSFTATEIEIMGKTLPIGRMFKDSLDFKIQK